ncbi:AAA family ATPase [Streptomyces sp. NPDC126499]|uniref:ATP-binding protein n=1 Tax=Streptomyces sp. NPDC126499 TaxID=3155314 RepID=UPI0033347794
MAAHVGGPAGQGFRLFEREAELAAAEEALDLLTGRGADPGPAEAGGEPTRGRTATDGARDPGPAEAGGEPTPERTAANGARGPGRGGDGDTVGGAYGARLVALGDRLTGQGRGLGAGPEAASGSGDAEGHGESGGGSGGEGGGEDAVAAHGRDRADAPAATDARPVRPPRAPGAPALRVVRGVGETAPRPVVAAARRERAAPAPRRGGVLAVAAPAGLGKTTLLAEIRRRAAARGCTVLSARGGDQERQGAFHVARQLLRPHLSTASRTELRTHLGDRYDVVGPVLGLCAAAEGGPPDPRDLRDGLDQILTHLVAGRAPVVVVLDDAHRADPESLDWLSALSPRAEELPVLLVVAYRPDELPAALVEFRGARSGRPPLTLEPLSPAAIARLVRDRIGVHADDAFCRAYGAVTAGNPFEAVQLAARIRDRGLDPTADLATAVKGSGLITRIERLGTATVRLAWACAVLGTGISPRLAGAVAGLGDEEVARGAALLRGAGVLTEGRGDEAGSEEDETGTAATDNLTLTFVHPLIATAVYDAIPAATRVALHGQAAWCVIEAGLGSTAAARHLVETHPDADPWVVRHLRAAARETLRAGAPDTARRYLARALREPPDRDERAAVLFELGYASLLTESATAAHHLRADEPDAPALPHGLGQGSGPQTASPGSPTGTPSPAPTAPAGTPAPAPPPRGTPSVS